MSETPMCYGCGDKPAKRLKLPGNYGREKFFCSLTCAAIEGLQHPINTGQVWCPKHKLWTEGECWECAPPNIGRLTPWKLLEYLE